MTTALVILIVLACFVAYLLLRPIISGATYFPTHPRILGRCLNLSALSPGSKIADLGSGDGRVLILFARHGIEAHGFEVNPLLVLWSRLAIRRAGLQKLAFVHHQSYWGQDLRGFDAVIFYGFPGIMRKIGQKLKKDARPGIPIISNVYEIPDWQPVKKDSGLILYRL